MSNFSIITWSEHERKKVAQFSKTKSPGQLMTVRAINMRTGPYFARTGGRDGNNGENSTVSLDHVQRGEKVLHLVQQKQITGGQDSM